MKYRVGSEREEHEGQMDEGTVPDAQDFEESVSVGRLPLRLDGEVAEDHNLCRVACGIEERSSNSVGVWKETGQLVKRKERLRRSRTGDAAGP